MYYKKEVEQKLTSKIAKKRALYQLEMLVFIWKLVFAQPHSSGY